MQRSSGIHHITGITGDARKNYDFYTRVLGLRFVKRTVNFDDPSAWHLYYGDETGSPGSALTFFHWEGAARGEQGRGQAVEVAYAVPKGSLDYWRDRLQTHDIAAIETERFGDRVLSLTDFDRMKIELVETDAAAGLSGWTGGPAPAEHAVRGFAGITLRPHDGSRTAEVLRDGFGFSEAGTENGRRRFLGDAAIGSQIDIASDASAPRAREGAGTLHHVAFRAADTETEAEIADRIRDTICIDTTPQIDRMYFRSVYFREPGGILFEIATDGPGFTIDEPKATLGQSLKLPPWYEPYRERIERELPPLE